MDINRYIEILCNKYGTYIFDSININNYMESMCAKYGTYIFHNY